MNAEARWQTMWEERWSDEDVAGQGRRGKNMGLESVGRIII